MSRTPIYEQLVDQFEKFILTGALLPGSQIPSVRSLSIQLSINPNTVQKAYSELVSLSGKTGTAQSGVYENKKEILRTWFSGFFPSDNPNYVVVVMNENGEGGNSDCAPVFKKICEGIVTR